MAATRFLNLGKSGRCNGKQQRKIVRPLLEKVDSVDLELQILPCVIN